VMHEWLSFTRLGMIVITFSWIMVLDCVQSLRRRVSFWSALSAGIVAPSINESMLNHQSACRCRRPMRRFLRPTSTLALSLAFESLHASPSDVGRGMCVPPAATWAPISLATAPPLTATQRHLAPVCPPCGAAPSFAFRIVPHSFPFRAALLLLLLLRQVKRMDALYGSHSRRPSLPV
jgi:hypothetical protein